MQDYIQIHEGDSVAVALRPLPAGTAVEADGVRVTAREDIPQGHKFALKDIAAGEPVIKYLKPDAGSLRLMYKFTDLYENEFWTPALTQ